MSKSKVSEQKLDSLQNADAVLNHQETEVHFEVPALVERKVPAGEILGKLKCTPSQSLSTCPSNLNFSNSRHQAMAFNAAAEGDYVLDATKPLKITATHYLAFPAEVANQETGEISTVTFLALFDAGGKFVKTTSEVVAARVASALEMYRAEDWKAGIHFILSPKISPRSKRTYHDIRIDLDMYK